MNNNKFEIKMFDGESICFPYESIIVCNKSNKDSILNKTIKVEAPTPYIIITNDSLSNDEINILEDASIGDCLSHFKSRPAFGGILV